MGAFNDKVFEVVKQIPYGCVSTYGDIARAIGQPRKALFVGYAMKSSLEPGADMPHEEADLLLGSGPIGAALGVAHVAEALVGQRAYDGPGDGEPAEARVEDADGLV